MASGAANLNQESLRWRQTILLMIAGVGCFHLAYAFTACACLIGVYVYCVCGLTALPTLRQAVYLGLVVGLAVAAPHLAFFWNIFRAGAIGLWFVAAAWTAIFISCGWWCRRRYPGILGIICLPILWTGLEYFRSEIYYLRFAWLTPGLAFSFSPGLFRFALLGVYGIGFVLAVAAASILCLRRSARVTAGVLLTVCTVIIACISNMVPTLAPDSRPEPAGSVRVAGVQMEFPYTDAVLNQLDLLRQHYPDAQLFVLSEYTLDHAPPAQVSDWCVRNKAYLLLGGIDQQREGWYDTAFVIDPDGKVVFKQAKAVPIQLMRDGLPAPTQQVWHSPWGNIGICICYDLSYTRVVDNLIRQGAHALIVPTMDVGSWGAHEHLLHARIAPMRAAEYHIPVFRVASSGISQWTTPEGWVGASAPFPGPNAQITGVLDMRRAGRLPLDRIVAPLCMWASTGLLMWMAIGKLRSRRIPQRNLGR